MSLQVQPEEKQKLSGFDIGSILVIMLAWDMFFLAHPITMYQQFGTFEPKWILLPAGLWLIALLILWKIIAIFRSFRVPALPEVIRVLLFIIIGLPFLYVSLSLFLLIFLAPFFANNSIAFVVPLLIVQGLFVLMWLSLSQEGKAVNLKIVRTLALLISAMVPIHLFVLRAPFKVHDQLSFSDHHYVAIMEFRLLDSFYGEVPILFECDRYSLNCIDVMEGSPVFTRADNPLPQLTLHAERSENIIYVYQDGVEIIHYQPDSGEALHHAFLGIR
jgi:hypothetical protein